MKELSAAFESSMFNFAQIAHSYPTPSEQDEDYLGWVNGEN